MEELYVESFFKTSTKVDSPAETPSPQLSSQPLKKEQQIHSCFLLLEQEIQAEFPHAHPVHTLFHKIKQEFAASKHTRVIELFDQLEELIDTIRL